MLLNFSQPDTDVAPSDTWVCAERKNIYIIHIYNYNLIYCI